MHSRRLLFAAALMHLGWTLPAHAGSVTNTETVHALSTWGDRVVACTEGGLDLFQRDGRFLRTLHVEDGLPSTRAGRWHRWVEACSPPPTQASQSWPPMEP